MRNVIASQLVCHNHPRIATVGSQQSGKEASGCVSIALFLHEYIYDLSILIDGAPQIVRFPADLDKDLIKIERITEPQVPTLQAPRVSRAKLVTSKPDRLTADDDTSLGQ